jgi:Zn-dependent protease
MIIGAIGIRAGIMAGVLEQPGSVGYTSITQATTSDTALTFAATFISLLFFQNLLLGTFNLMPVPPLDGSTGITILMSERLAMRFLEFIRDPTWAMAGIVGAWFLFGKLFYPIFAFALNVLYPGSNYRF